MKLYSNKATDKPKKKGTGAEVTRNAEGTLVREESANYQGQTNDKVREGRVKAKGTSSEFSGGVAPRVGGDKDYKSIVGAIGLTGGSKKQMRQSKKNVRSNSASPQAKRSARKLY